MNAYDALAASYDALTYDVPYEKILAFWETVLHGRGKRPASVVDLACGTGSLSVLLAERGYDVTGVDSSEEMLTQAAGKAAGMEHPPMLVRQKMESLRLPAPADWIVSCLDGLNYVNQDACRKTMRRCFDSLAPGGMLTFDVSSPHKLRQMDGQVWLDETEREYCVWRTEFDEKENVCRFGVDLFTRQGSLWRREFEEHRQYAHRTEDLTAWLEEAGFRKIRAFGDLTMEPPKEDARRIFLAAEKEQP